MRYDRGSVQRRLEIEQWIETGLKELYDCDVSSLASTFSYREKTIPRLPYYSCTILNYVCLIVRWCNWLLILRNKLILFTTE